MYRILLVEDDKNIRTLIVNYFTKKEKDLFTVDVACDGQAGLEKAYENNYDCLLLDVMLQYGCEIDENSLFLFCGRRTDRIKALWFSGDGFVLLYKRLNNGSFQWPRSKDELKLLTPQSFRWLMEGLTTEPKKVIKKSRQKDMF